MTTAGTLAEALLLASDTDTPPAGAELLKVTVPVEEVKLATLAGLSVTEERAVAAVGAVTASAAVLLTPL